MIKEGGDYTNKLYDNKTGIKKYESANNKNGQFKMKSKLRIGHSRLHHVNLMSRIT